MIRNRNGQVAIFIALIFQVLFVLFAMAINIALVVHDKINLQNAVDLAAYYAAERQAEMLNVIAHENYMIRQSWKLLAWRYRVLGSDGVVTPNTHPVISGDITDLPFQFDPNSIDPAVCVTHAGSWADVNPDESLCKKPATAIPPLPKVRVIAGFLGFNYVFAALTDKLRATMANNCSQLGAYNWWYAMVIMQAFREDQRNRKQVINAIAKNLSGRGDNDFMDLDGNSVYDGALRTYQKNLTYSNSQAQINFQMMNSMQGIRRDQWLSDVMISPTIRYVDPQEGDGCFSVWQNVATLPSRGTAVSFLRAPLPNGLDGSYLESFREENILADNDYQMTLGVEKNPWAMAYVGVRAETAPRPIFIPWGESVTIKARAFAKPFGGRIGPWYGSRWPRGSDRSIGEESDQLIPSRSTPSGFMGSENDPRRLPNYSRFPGDVLGLRSRLSLNSLNGFQAVKASYNYYLHAGKPIQNDPSAYNEVVAADPFDFATMPAIRKFEIAAIAPDLYDVTYYSIENNFSSLILPKLRNNRVKIGIPDTVALRGDLGQNDKIPGMLGFSVVDQFKMAQNLGSGTTGASLQNAEAYYYVRSRENVLTSWTSGDVLYNYSFPSGRFGVCKFDDDDLKPEFKVPGGCLARGGRSGYSVKLVSRNMLLSNSLPIGGDKEAPGGIINPPLATAGW